MIPKALDIAVEKDPHKNAEVKIFKEIQKDINLNEWICLHSLNIETTKSGFCGETDFVLIGPDGIFCLEVKGGVIEKNNEGWFSNGKSGRKKNKRSIFTSKRRSV